MGHPALTRGWLDGITGVLEVHGADPVAGGGEDGVAKGGGEGWNAGLAEARGAEVGLDEVNLHGWSAAHAEDGVVAEVGLLDAAFFEGDLKAHGCGEGVDGASLGLVLC